MESFGQIISSERRARGASLKDVAGVILKADGHPISLQYLANLEKDMRAPSPELVPQFARLFGLPADLLFAVLGLLSPDLHAWAGSRAQLLSALQAFRQALETPTGSRPGERAPVRYVRSQAPRTPPPTYDAVFDGLSGRLMQQERIAG